MKTLYRLSAFATTLFFVAGLTACGDNSMEPAWELVVEEEVEQYTVVSLYASSYHVTMKPGGVYYISFDLMVVGNLNMELPEHFTVTVDNKNVVDVSSHWWLYDELPNQVTRIGESLKFAGLAIGHTTVTVSHPLDPEWIVVINVTVGG